MSIMSSLSAAMHTREDGLIFLMAVFAGYPLAAIYRLIFYSKSPTVQHVYFVVAGLALYILSFGAAVFHSIISILLAYWIVTYFPGQNVSIVLAHLAFLGHLLIGYTYSETDNYDINWTTPFCVMTLRFIGLVMDVYDGHKPGELKKYQIQTSIKKSPNLLEIAAFGYFFCGTFTGPLFTLSRFRSFVAGEYLDSKKEVRISGLMPSLGRFVMACFYIIIYQWGVLWIPNEYFNSPEFFALSFRWKVIWIVLWFRIIMCRYISVWLFTEGAAILAGIAYNGKDLKGNDRWDGVRDVHIKRWEFGLDFQSVIDSFNVGTNTFAKNNLYRRLQWLGNQTYSHFITLIYLAIWHGYHLGYFIIFVLEFGCILAQKQFYLLLSKSPKLSHYLAQPYMLPLKFIFGRIVINVSMGIGFLTFGLVKTRNWIRVCYIFHQILFFLIFWLSPEMIRFSKFVVMIHTKFLFAILNVNF
uniref:Lysophospholipid acyltransferase 5 n=1 Tax=Onchocerca volvulus TaxID=6282 RepID=A0A8R1TK51_ONCVO